MKMCASEKQKSVKLQEEWSSSVAVDKQSGG